MLSVEHYPNTMTLQPGAFAEVHKMVAALRKAYASRDLHLVGFERYGGSQCCASCPSVSARFTVCSCVKAVHGTAAGLSSTSQHVP